MSGSRWEDFPIFGDYNKRTDINLDTEDLNNLFLIQDPKGKKQFAFLATPGTELEITLFPGTAQCRGLFAFGNYLYAVFNQQVFRLDQFFQPTLIGTVNTVSGLVSIKANNGTQIIFTDGVNGFIYDTSAGTFTQISDSGFPPFPLNVVFLDGYFVIPSGNARTYQISALNDGTKWDALDIAQIQAYPGINVGVGVVNRRLYFFKTDSTEVWYNNGDADFPFRRDNNLLFNFGCLAAASIASEFGYLCWLAQDKDGVGSVMMTTGQEPTIISSEAIDNVIANFTNPTDVFAYIYKDDKHIFYVMNFTTDDTTLVYDIFTQSWFKMSMTPTYSQGSISNPTPSRHIGNCHAYFLGSHYIGSFQTAEIYGFSRSFITNNGDPIVRLRTAKHFFDPQYRMLQIDQLQIDMEMGIGVSGSNNGDVGNFWVDNSENFIIDNVGNFLEFNPDYAESDQDAPIVYLYISRDGGHVFGNAHPASIGRIGERKVRAIFRQLGVARDFVAKFVVYSPVYPITIFGAAIKYKVLNK